MELSERKKAVLSKIVEQYIATGEPVGSKAVCGLLDLACSPATVRNDMAELIELGYLAQPHTSAGRIPSNKGYRFYVNSLMKRYSLTDQDKKFIDSLLPGYLGDPDDFVSRAGEALAEFTRCAAITTSPIDSEAAVQKVEAIRIGSGTLLIVVLTSSGMLKNRICCCEPQISDADIELFVNIANKEISGKRVSEITPAVTQSFAAGLGEHMLTFAPVINTLFMTIQDLIDLKLRYEGEANLFFHHDFSKNNLIMLINFLRRGEALTSLLYHQKKDMEVFIGDETSDEALSQASIITAKYTGNNHAAGKIAIIGPTRMDYSHIIPSMEYFASCIEKILLKNSKNEV